jgi:hypothetical protein
MFQVGDLVKYKDDYLKSISTQTYEYFMNTTYVITKLETGWEEKVKAYGYDTVSKDDRVCFLGTSNLLELVDDPCEITDFL